MKSNTVRLWSIQPVTDIVDLTVIEILTFTDDLIISIIIGQLKLSRKCKNTVHYKRWVGNGSG